VTEPTHFLNGQKKQHQHNAQHRDAHPKFSKHSGHALTLVREACSVKEIPSPPDYLRAPRAMGRVRNNNGTIAQAADGKALSWHRSKCDVTHIARRQGASSA
jgi:hypothetical protein